MAGSDDVLLHTERLRQRVAELEAVERQCQEHRRQLEVSQGHFRGIVDNLLEGCQIIGHDWRYLYVNKAVVQQSRLSEDALLGHTMMEAYPGIEGTELFATLKFCMERRIPRRIENEFSFPDGSKGWFDLSIEPVPEGIFILSMERTEQKRLEEYTNQQYRLASIGQFAAGIAHDFNNTLTVITGTAQILQMNPRIPVEAHEDLKAIDSQGQRAAQLIRQILDFSRETVAKRQPVDLIPFLREAARLLGRMLPESIEIRTDFSAQAWVRANLSQFQQVLNNLAANSRDAMPGGGTVEIKVSRLRLEPGSAPPCPKMRPGAWLCWTFSDTGPGIPASVIKHIFEPFYTTKPKGEGTGLGLAQVHGIVGQHEGFIDVETQEGQGTTFLIYLPEYLELTQPDGANSRGVLPKGNGQTILVVEDEQPVLKVVRLLLESLNYRPLVAANGRQALETYDAHRDEISLVLTDLVMPQMGGRELVDALLQRDPDLPYIVMTGYASEADKPQDWIEKAEDVLAKPLVLECVAEAINRVLRAGR